MSTIGGGLLLWYYLATYQHQREVRASAGTAASARADSESKPAALGEIRPPPAASASASPMEKIIGPAPPPPEVTNSPTALASATATASSTGKHVTPRPRKSAQAIARERELSGPVFAEFTSTEAGSGLRGVPPPMPSGVPSIGETGHESHNAGPAGALDTLLQPTLTPTVRATVLPTQELLLPKGAFIDCNLETAIDSSLPGLTTCITATDTFGVDGKVVLLERGTKLVGETRGIVAQGTSRVFVLWTEARTPTGVVVPLASPGTDELGRSGLPGEVNRHFFERFGAAMLISIIDGAVQAAIASQSRGGAVILNPTASEEVTTEVLKGTVNIPPTVVKANGDRIQVLVARDLDFRSVYELRHVDSN
jgi:type IV secretion system protein VirB10